MSAPCLQGPPPDRAAHGSVLVHVPRAKVDSDGLRARLMCFARTLVVGFGATVVDFALLAACVRWLHIEVLPSRCIALVLSGVLTFVGSRRFAFRAQGGSVPRQAGRFVAAEVAGVLLNLISFRLCGLCAPLLAPELVSFIANALVFVGFSYPVRRLLVFSRS
jgi:putative flippase GtrA